MKKFNFHNRGQSLIEIIIVLVAVGLIGGGLYYYLSKQIPEVPEITEKPAEEVVAPEEEVVAPPPEEGMPSEEIISEEKPVILKCADGTIYSQCSTNKPKYCDNGNLVDKCSICGCSSGQECQTDESCIEVKKCLDGTPYGRCAIGKPKYCNQGVIVNQCSLCGCPSGLECQIGEGCMKPNPPYICGCSPRKECQRSECKISNPLIVVVINSSIYSDLQSSLNQYKADLEKEGYVVKFHLAAEETPEDLRSYLQGELSNHLVGALLIGDLSLPWFLHGKGESRRKFPIDLFYMDLNGSWFDTDNDGIYDRHESGSGDILPEIWVGRLIPPEGFGDPIDLLNNYFRKNHAYRMRELTLPQRALAYSAFPNYLWVNTLSSIYNGNVTVVLPEQSSAKDYLNKLSQGYQFVNMGAHGGNCFDIPEWSCFSPDELYQIDPKAFFYDITGCGACNYTHPYQYIGGTYVFAPSFGLAVFGALTEKGGLGSSNRLYSFLAMDNTLGDSYKEFLANEMLTENFTCNRSSMGETVLLGDPTLRLTP